jgi:hypothetical protein
MIGRLAELVIVQQMRRQPRQDVATALQRSKTPTRVEIHMRNFGWHGGSRLSAPAIGSGDVCREIWGPRGFDAHYRPSMLSLLRYRFNDALSPTPRTATGAQPIAPVSRLPECISTLKRRFSGW